MYNLQTSLFYTITHAKEITYFYLLFISLRIFFNEVKKIAQRAYTFHS